jgi:hypothetical protein
MNDPVEEKVNRWDQSDEETISTKYSDINRKIIYLSERLFTDYELELGPKLQFFKKLNNWLENISDDDDQKLMFELIPYCFYIGREEMNVLYREAYITQYINWLFDIEEISLVQDDIPAMIEEETVNTWFCPLTDSLRINQFYHINDIPGKHDFRPDFRSLRQFGDINKIKAYIKEQGIKRIVLLEDFIGNGGQVSKAVNFAVTNFPDIKFLIIPLILCPAGIINSRALEEKLENVTIRHVLTIPQEYFVNHVEENNSAEFRNFFHLANKTYEKVSNSPVVNDKLDPYGPFGWNKTGGLIIMHTNTPNNTLPLIHHQSNTWTPLFKRHKRI